MYWTLPGKLTLQKNKACLDSCLGEQPVYSFQEADFTYQEVKETELV